MAPTPVGLSTPPGPKPAPRMLSTKVLWGTRLTATLLANICFCTFGFSPMWLVVSVETSAASNNFPTPLPGTAASLQMIDSSDFLCLTTSSSRRSGVPTPMNPPTMTLAPLGIMATASSTEMDFLGGSDCLNAHYLSREPEDGLFVCIKGHGCGR